MRICYCLIKLNLWNLIYLLLDLLVLNLINCWVFKSLLDLSVFAPHSTHFVPSSSSEPSISEVVSETVKPPVSEVVKPIEVSSSRKIRVDLKEDRKSVV